MHRNHFYQRGGGKPFSVDAHRINRFTDPQMEQHFNPIHGLILCEIGYLSNLYFLQENKSLDTFSKYFVEMGETEETLQIFKKTIISRNATLIKSACTKEHGSNVIIPTKSIMYDVTLRELGNYIAIKYVNKFRTEKIAVRNQKGNYASDPKYRNPELHQRLTNVKKCIGKINQRIPIVYKIVDDDKPFDDNIFAFHIILFCVWWKANNSKGIDEYYEGVKEVFDIVNAQFPNEPRLEFNDVDGVSDSDDASTSASAIKRRRIDASASARASARARMSDGDSDGDSDGGNSNSNSNGNKSFEQLVLDITRVDFHIYDYELTKHFCKEMRDDKYADCGETVARNIINILCFDGTKFNTKRLKEKGAIPELIAYYKVFSNFELQSQIDSEREIYGMRLNSRDAWSKLIIDYAHTNVVLKQTCHTEPKYGYEIKSGLSKDGKTPNLLQIFKNLMQGIEKWEDLENDETIASIDAEQVGTNGFGEIILTTQNDKTFTILLENGHFYVKLPKIKEKIVYDHITDPRQRATIDVLLKENITEDNFININFSSDVLKETYNKFEQRAESNNVASSHSTSNVLFCLFQLSTTKKYNYDLRRQLEINTSNLEFIEKLVEYYGENPIINEYSFFINVINKSTFEFVRRLPALTVLNYKRDLWIHNPEKTQIDLTPLKNIERIGDQFLFSGKQPNINFKPLEGDEEELEEKSGIKLKIIGNEFLSLNDATEIDLSDANQLSEIGEQFATNCDKLKTVKFNKDANITSVGQYFLTRSSIQEIDMSCFKNIKSIHKMFLSECRSLTKVKFPESMPHIKTIDLLFMSETKKLKTIDLSCFSNVEKIEYGFLKKSGIETIDLSKMTKVKNIGMYFMEECEHLKTIDLSGFSNVETIDSYFLQKTAIEEIDLSKMTKLKSVGEKFMYMCDKLKKVILPPNLAHMQNPKYGNFFGSSSGIKFIIASPDDGGGGAALGGSSKTRRRRTTRKNKKNLKKSTRKRK